MKEKLKQLGSSPAHCTSSEEKMEWYFTVNMLKLGVLASEINQEYHGLMQSAIGRIMQVES